MENRKYVRLKGSNIPRCEVFVAKDFGRDFLNAAPVQIKDVSGNGFLFTTTVAYPLGTFLRLELELPLWERFRKEYYKGEASSSNAPLVVLAKVVRVQEIKTGKFYHVAVTIVDIDEGDRKAFMAFLECSENQ